MALTLLEAAKLVEGDTHRQAVIELFARNSEILAAIPFENIPGDSLSYNQEGALPGVAFRGYNQAYTESTGVINPQVERLSIAGGDLDVDVALVKTRGPGIRARHVASKVKALAQTAHLKAIKGDAATSTLEPDGLQARLVGSQVVSNSGASGGAVLSMGKLDEAIDACDDATHLIMTKAMRRTLSTAAKTTSVSGTLNFAKDDFGRQMFLYNDLPILHADANDIASGYVSLGANEAYTGGGTSNGTSIYVVSMRPGMFQGLQNGIMDVRDLGELDTKPVYRTRVEWLMGFALMHPRAAVRLRDIKAGTAVA